MLYIETSVLFAYTLTQEKEPKRFAATAQFIENMNRGKFRAMTSLYTFIELYALATAYAENWEEGVRLAKVCFLTVLQTEILIAGMLSREERILNEHRFRMIPDSSDVSHVLSAYLHHCKQIVTYDAHFDDMGGIMEAITPEQIMAHQEG